jgi:hypothetical protein
VSVRTDDTRFGEGRKSYKRNLRVSLSFITAYWRMSPLWGVMSHKVGGCQHCEGMHHPCAPWPSVSGIILLGLPETLFTT